MTVLVTGAGLVGTYTAKLLLDQGVGVLLYDTDPSARYIESVVGPDQKLLKVERGEWGRPYRGVFIDNSAPVTPMQPVVAAFFAVGGLASHRLGLGVWLWLGGGLAGHRPSVLRGAAKRKQGRAAYPATAPPRP